jgi:hypothetical protein
VGEIVATLLTTGYFFKHEIKERGSSISPADFSPIALSTGAVIVYFFGAAFGWWSVGWVWLLTLSAIATASVWGWNGLEPELRSRLLGMVRPIVAR